MDKVLIVGAGVIGLSLARELRKKGVKSITIVERALIGREASHAAGGMLAPFAETNKTDAFFEFCCESLKLYADFAEVLLGETGVDIGLDKEGTLFLAFDEKDTAELNARYEWQKKAGLAVERLSPTVIRRLEPFVSPNILGGLFFPNDWQVENRKLVRALQIFCELNEIKIIENTEIKRLLVENGNVKGAESASAKYFADAVILATGAWTSLIQSDVQLPEIKPIRGQMIEFRTAKRLFSKVIYSPRGYLIPRRDGRILIGATSEDAGFDKSVKDSASEILREIALEISPSLVNLKIIDSWTGLRPFATDGLPVLGEVVENLFVATAHYRNGILLAPATAKVLAEKLVNKKDSGYFESFSVNRFGSARL